MVIPCSICPSLSDIPFSMMPSRSIHIAVNVSTHNSFYRLKHTKSSMLCPAHPDRQVRSTPDKRRTPPGLGRSHSLSRTLEMTLCATSIAGVNLGAGTHVKRKNKQTGMVRGDWNHPSHEDRGLQRVGGKLCPFLELVGADLGPTQHFHLRISQARGTQPASPDPQHLSVTPFNKLVGWGAGEGKLTRPSDEKNGLAHLLNGTTLNNSACQRLNRHPWQSPSLVTVCPSEEALIGNYRIQ